jgi:tetratricopeptide (TPR) repeat protein
MSVASAMDHPERARVAEIVVTRGTRITRGSGYLITPGWVLTACHVVHEAASVSVWLGAPSTLAPKGRLAVDIALVLRNADADLALLPVGGHAGDRALEPALFGRLDRDPGPPVPVAAAGCPRFKLRPDPGEPGTLLRELHYAVGSIAPLSNSRTGRYEFAVQVAPGLDPEPEHSPWEGMSGASVWGGGRLIGVIGQHYPREGLGILTVRPVDQLFRFLSETELHAWREAVPQIPRAAEGLWPASPLPAREIRVARARRAVEALAPPVLIGRGAELAELAAFTASETRWRWIQGEAFAGKTALLAWFAQHPPDRLDVVTCFLRRTSGDNTADYALDVLTRQLALLAGQSGYLPPPFLSERASDLADLLDQASRACTLRSRRLLVLIDGLDEYDAIATNLDLAAWLPEGSALPDEAMLVAASRTGADVRVPPSHPLRSHVQPITASEAAAEVRDAARAELERGFTTPGGFMFPVVCCLAVADGGLTPGELRALLRLRGRDTDVSEVEALLGSSLNRSLVRVPDLDGVGAQVYVFAHDSLLTEARAILAADIAAYEDLLDVWADGYSRRDWPVDTPRYLLRPYSRALARRARDPVTPDPRCRAAVDQLFAVVAQPSRSLQLFERTGNPAVPDRDIVAAQHVIIDTRTRSGLDDDEVLFRLAVLALRRRRTPLTGASAVVATRVAVVWARIGRFYAAMDLAAGIDGRRQQAEALSRVAVALGQTGQPGPALQAVADISDPRRQADALGMVAPALARGGHAGEALRAAADLDGEQRIEALCGIAVVLAQTGQPGPALQAVADISDPRRQADALGMVAPALARGGHAGEALRAAVRIHEPERRVKALADTARALAGVSPVQATDAARQALQTACGIYVPWQRADALCEAATALAYAGQTEAALQVTADIVPWRRAETRSAVAAALAEAGEAEAAMEAAASIHYPWRRAETLGKVAGGLARAGQDKQAADAARQAQQAIGDITDQGQLAVTLTVVSAALAEMGRAEQAARTAGKAVQAAEATGDPEQRADTLAKIAEVLTQAALTLSVDGQTETALRILAQVHDRQRQAEAFQEVAEALARAGHFSTALQITAQIDNSRRADTLGRIAEALAAAGYADQAASIASQALQAAVGIDGPWRREEALNDVADALAQAEEADQASDPIAHELHAAAAGVDDPWRQADTLGRVAVAQAEAGHADQAASIASQALRAAVGIHDAGWRADALSSLAIRLAGTGQVRALQAAVGIEVPGGRADALMNLLVALIRAGKVATAIEAADNVYFGHRDETRITLVMALAAADQATTAFRIANEMDQSWNTEALAAIALALAAKGQTEQAADAVGNALRVLAGIRSTYRRDVSMLSTAEVLHQVATAALRAGAAHAELVRQASAEVQRWWRRTGQDGLAMGSDWDYDYWDRRDKLLESRKGPKRQTEPVSAIGPTLRQVAVALAGAAESEPALQTAARIRDRQFRMETLVNVIVVLADAGQAGPALRAAAEISDRHWRDMALTGVAMPLARAGQAKLASQAVAEIGDRRRHGEALTGVAIALASAGQAGPALQAVAGIGDPEQRNRALAALLPGPLLRSSAEREAGRRALELLLLTPNASKHYMAAIPVALLRRLAEITQLHKPSQEPSA